MIIRWVFNTYRIKKTCNQLLQVLFIFYQKIKRKGRGETGGRTYGGNVSLLRIKQPIVALLKVWTIFLKIYISI